MLLSVTCHIPGLKHDLFEVDQLEETDSSAKRNSAQSSFCHQPVLWTRPTNHRKRYNTDKHGWGWDLEAFMHPKAAVESRKASLIPRQEAQVPMATNGYDSNVNYLTTLLKPRNLLYHGSGGHTRSVKKTICTIR